MSPKCDALCLIHFNQVSDHSLRILMDRFFSPIQEHANQISAIIFSYW